MATPGNSIMSFQSSTQISGGTKVLAVVKITPTGLPTAVSKDVAPIDLTFIAYSKFALCDFRPDELVRNVKWLNTSLVGNKDVKPTSRAIHHILERLKVFQVLPTASFCEKEIISLAHALKGLISSASLPIPIPETKAFSRA